MESRQEDNIPAELLRAVGDNVVKFFTRREWSDDWTTSILACVIAT